MHAGYKLRPYFYFLFQLYLISMKTISEIFSNKYVGENLILHKFVIAVYIFKI